MKQATLNLIGGFVALHLSVLATSALAQAVCGPYPDIVKLLSIELSETLVSSGLHQNGNLIQVFASPVGGWSMVITRPDGLSCISSAGEGWHNETLQIAHEPKSS